MSAPIDDRLNSVLNFSTDDPNSKSMTQQQFVLESDINHIMSKYQKTGTLPQIMDDMRATYQDVSKVGDFHDLQTRLIDLQTEFLTIPSSVRDLFRNDPAIMLKWLEDPKNAEQAKALGLSFTEQVPITNSVSNSYDQTPQKVSVDPDGSIKQFVQTEMERILAVQTKK